MKRTYLFALLCLGFAILLGLFIWYYTMKTVPFIHKDIKSIRQDVPDLSKNHEEESTRDDITDFEESFLTPIKLYGKIVDQYGDPVVGATVKLYPADTPWEESKSKGTMISDEEGRFFTIGLRGTSMGVQVSKTDYLSLPPLGGPASSAMVDYSDNAKSGRRFSSPATPLILTLHKIGPVEPLIYVPDARWRLPLDGTIQKISLDSETGEGSHQIEFSFKSDWSKLPKDNEINSKQFSWTFEARIPGGGFVWNDSDFNFEAPEFGYKETIRYHYPVDLPREKWKRFQHGRYFVMFADGTYGKIRFDIDGGSDRKALKMTSWLSLTAGSRNLATQLIDASGFHGGDPEQ